MIVSVLAVLIALSSLASMFYYWATAKHKWMKAAYIGAVLNGFALIWINWRLALGEGDWSVNIFSVLSVWLVISGFRGLARLRAEGRRSSVGRAGLS